MKAILRAAAILAALTAAPALSFAATGPGTGLATYQCAPNQNITTPSLPTGGPYTAAADGIVLGVNANDDHVMDNAGCVLVGVGNYTLVSRTIGVNMNITTDQPLTMLIAPNQNYTPVAVWVRNCSVSLTTAAGSFYTAASKSGTTVAGSGTTQAYTGCTATGLTAAYVVATAAGLAAVLPATTPPILSLTTGQGATATADIYVYGIVGN